MDRAVHSSDSSPDSRSDFYIVGVGASAGGLEAIESMFQAMPKDVGMAFVLVQHLSPDFKSLMLELLSRDTTMPIHRVEDGMQVEPNSIYLIPANQEMIISHGLLRLKEKDPNVSLSLPIDHFLESLAIDVGPRSIGVILSGTGSDGSRGIAEVHKAGGLVIAQSVESAKFDGMPRSAIDTNLVDVIVEPEKIPDVLTRYVTHPYRSLLQQHPMDESSMEHIFRLLLERHRIDFNYYKPGTINRRIERRIQLNHRSNIEDYVHFLEESPSELDELHKDLLIGVTSMFRDPEAFDSLKNTLLNYLDESHGTRNEFRAWVSAAGTGEEAYSIAIILDECLRELGLRLPVKIFATDVNQASLDTAQAGVYSKDELEEISPERLERYFSEVEGGYQIEQDIRQMIVFAPHNLVKDTPFTRLDLISCRNFLIYLRPLAQKKIISLFHFGLKTGGLLFLGASETTGDLADEFEPLIDRWNIYRKRRDVHISQVIDGVLNADINKPKASGQDTIVPRIPREPDLQSTYDELLGEYMPAAILVDHNCEMLHMFGGAGEFLTIRDGRPSNRLLDMVDGNLKLAITGGIQSAEKKSKRVRYHSVMANTASGTRPLEIEIIPVGQKEHFAKYLITFNDVEESKLPAAGPSENLDVSEVTRDQIEGLEQDLRRAKQSLRSTVEELETSNEELQATNEELTASNEELQSTNEELHSVNEELYTVNAEFQKKILDLTEMTHDMENLLESTEVHTLFLDENLCVRKFTPMMAEVFNLVTRDIGRRISSFSYNLDCEDLTGRASEVLETGELFEQRVNENEDQQFLLRMLPYRAENRISGVVLTLVDITTLAEAEEDALHERERFQRAILANRDGTWDWPDVANENMWWSDTCYQLLGYEPGEFPATYSQWLKNVHPEDRALIEQTSVPSQEKCFVELHRQFEYRMQHKSGEYRWYEHRAIIDFGDDGSPLRMTGTVGDIHDRKISEFHSVEEIHRRDNFLAMLSHELRNPMGAVLSAINSAKSPNESPADGQAELHSLETAKDAMQIIGRQTKYMARLLDDLLDVARFGQNRIEFRQEVVDLKLLAEEVMEAFSHELRDKDMELHIDFGSEPIFVVADPARMKQAQINLLSNAAKYTPEGGDIWYEISQQANEAIISIRDNGDGIPPKMLDSIFELFVQSESNLAHASGGIGVGLSLARSIVEAHYGTLTAESEGEGQGSTFTIRLPVTVNTKKAVVPVPHISFDDRSLLLVEDNDDARMMLAKTLRMQGFVVHEASDGFSALEKFKNVSPEVAIVDIGLPVMDGYQFARAVRQLELDWDFVLIALTGYGQDSDREQALKSGFDAHLVKPLDPVELYRTLAQNLSPAHIQQ